MKRFAVLAWLLVSAGCSSAPTPGPVPSPPSDPESQTSDVTAEGGAGSGTHSGGGDARDAGFNADPGAFGAACTAGSDCESNVCYSGGKGGFCSLTCTSDTQCPAGADGTQVCNPHGYCRY